MRATSASDHGPNDLRRPLDRLDGLPLRPSTARLLLAALPEDDGSGPDAATPGDRPPASTEVDPAWALRRSRDRGRSPDPLASLADHRWWPFDPAPEILTRIWRQGVAVAFAARRLAREAGDPDPDAIARAGLLHNLGLWALAAVAPDRLPTWMAADRDARADLGRRWFGSEVSGLGRSLAERWGCEPLVVDAAWLHADLGADLGVCSAQPGRLALIQQAYALAERTPWALGGEATRDLAPPDPRVRLLTAEVQVRCGAGFVEPDATPREEALTREVARLRRSHARLAADREATDRLVRFVAGSSPTEGPASWADRAGLAWCSEPGVAAARVVWSGPSPSDPAPPEAAHPASMAWPLGDPDAPSAHVHLWLSPGADGEAVRPAHLPAWDALAAGVAERDRLRRLVDDVASAHRGRVGREEQANRRGKLEALAEFAAGAGHELNNPLAVILGRAQLLMAREVAPDSARSLRAIIAQAQRAHRILRDLMYVARPPEFRPRPCQPDEIVRASLRDLQGEAEARGVRVTIEAREPGPRVWADPEPLRQVADVLVRNALEATPSGGTVQFTASVDGRKLRWIVHDTGRGIGPGEGAHLFDPFYCGRQAGRGLGLGLPRASRIVAQAGGELRWHSIPGQGSTFQVTWPVAEIPPAAEEDRPGPARGDRALPGR